MKIINGVPAIALCGVLLFSGPARLGGQDQPKQDTAAASASYPHTLEGLRTQFHEMLKAYQVGDAQKVDLLMKDLALQDPEAWLTRFFGKEQAAKLAPKYAGTFANFQSFWAHTADRMAKLPGLQILVAPWDKPAAPWAEPDPEDPAPTTKVLVETYELSIAAEGQGRTSQVLSFIYLDDAYRFIGFGTYPFWSRPSRIRVGGPVQSSMLVYKVRPAYPFEAKQRDIQGTVRLQAVIGKDGTVRELQVFEGHPILAEAALEAVRQWRYKPTLLNGKPVEVVTTIDVVFGP